jgi:hypothetical protein
MSCCSNQRNGVWEKDEEEEEEEEEEKAGISPNLFIIN